MGGRAATGFDMAVKKFEERLKGSVKEISPAKLR